ncbi:MAG: LPS-assembly protein LptD [Pseudomonadota bacterium]
MARYRSSSFSRNVITAAGAASLTLAILVAAPVTGVLDIALAQTSDDGANGATGVPLIDLPSVDDNEQMLIEADELIYNNENETVTARGTVQIYYGPYTLQADEVTYDQRQARLQARGRVRVTEPDGNVIYAEVADLADDFRDGFVRSLTVETPERTTVSAASAERVAGNTTIFNRGVYTACERCEENPDKPPLWQVKAVRIVHDQEDRVIYYENAHLEFLGIPVAWIPFFSNPDPTVKRKTGFLSPGIRYSEMLGAGLEVPYFINLAPNMDVTLSPVFSQRQVLLMGGEFRHRTTNGSYAVRGAGLHQFTPDKTPDNPGDDRDWRGYVETKGRFAINRNWDFGWDGTVVSDNGFLDSYGISGQTWLTSQVFLEGLSSRNSFEARAYHFQRLNSFSFDQSVLPNVLPAIDYSYKLDRDILGGEMGFDVSSYTLHRGDADSANVQRAVTNGLLQDMEYAMASRVVGEVYWRRTLADQWGQLFTPFASVRGDLYHTDGGYNPARTIFASTAFSPSYDDWVPLTLESETDARIIPTIGLEYSYPLASRQSWGTQVFEPIAQIYYRPDLHGGSVNRVNEDALSIVYDATSLFDRDKFSGYDRVETGLRANVGFRYSAKFNNGGYANLTAGRSFHLAGDNPFPEDSGLAQDAGDYVALASFSPNRNLTLTASTRLDGEDFAVERNEIGAVVRAGKALGSVSYAKIAAQPGLGAINDSEQILASASYQLNEHWRVTSIGRYDLAADQTNSLGAGIHYGDECFTFSLTYTETYSASNDIERTVGISFNLRTIGGVETSTTQSSLFEDGGTF